MQQLIDTCIQDDDKLYLCVSSPTIKEKPVQIRPWKLSDADFVLDASLPLDPRKTVFVGGVPRPLKAGTCPPTPALARDQTTGSPVTGHQTTDYSSLTVRPQNHQSLTTRPPHH